MFIDDPTTLASYQREPDVLVVGAGAVGIVLSLRSHDLDLAFFF